MPAVNAGSELILGTGGALGGTYIGGLTDASSAQWYTLAWRRVGGTTYYHISDIGAAFSNRLDISSGVTWDGRTGFTLLSAWWSTMPGAGWQVAAIVLYSTAPSTVELEAIHDAVS
jgi:hypothetical protein